MKESDFAKINKQINDAYGSLCESQSLLKELNEAFELPIDLLNESTSDPARILELILQYRFDSQNALMKLLHIDNGLLQILGISSLNPSSINIERMKFALGNDDLQHILHLISSLIHSLLLAAQESQKKLNKEHTKKSTKVSQPVKLIKYCVVLEKAISKQKQFIMTLEELMSNLDEWNKLASIGPIYDHIIALRGPISFYYQAEQNGLELAHDLFQKFNTALKLTQWIEPLLQQSNTLVHHLSPLPDSLHFFHAPHLEIPMQQPTAEQLEARAAKRRLGNFFNH